MLGRWGLYLTPGVEAHRFQACDNAHRNERFNSRHAPIQDSRPQLRMLARP